MEIRILHIFAPGYKSLFGGALYMWKYYFSSWNRSEIKHYVLDSDSSQVVAAKVAFCFEYSAAQKRTPRWKRTIWIITLLIDLLRYRDKYDVLHIHVLWWGTLLLGPLAKWMHIPALYESVLLNEDTPGGILKEPWGALKILCLRSYRTILAISDSLAKDYLQFGFSQDQVYTLMNCVDTEGFAPAKSSRQKMAARKSLGLPEDAAILLFVGSLIARKGVDLLVDAFKAASRVNPELYLLLVGPRSRNENPSLEEEFVSCLRSELEKDNLAGRVQFWGLVQDRQELSELYRAADMFVFPSRNEGLPSVVLEAMSSGLPVITSRLPGLEKVIHPGENGMFISIGDVVALKQSILVLCTDRSLAGRMGLNAREYILQHHGFDAWQIQVTALYARLFSRSDFGRG